MPGITKTITIQGGSLGGTTCNLTLAFLPPSADFTSVFPIAWKVFTVSESASFQWVWNDSLAAGRAVVNPNTGIVSVDEYTPLRVGQTTELTVNNNVHPPEYTFSSPVTYTQRVARVMNRTGNYVNIGGGWITDLDLPTETMNQVLISRRVMDQNPAYVNYAPVLGLWASLDYAESELLDGSIRNIAPLWKQNLLDITGTQVTITMELVNGKLVANGPSSYITLSKGITPRLYTYTVDLAFATPALVTTGVQAIVKELSAGGYGAFKLTHKGFDNEARLALTLPHSVSCNKAEMDMIAAIDANPTIYGKAYIKGHAGATLLRTEDALQDWVEVNPASAEWFGLTPGSASDTTAFNGTNAETFAKGNAENGTADPTPAVQSNTSKGKAGASEGEGVINSGDSAAQAADPDVKFRSAAQAADPDVKFRSVRRSGGGRRALAA
ncbi:hypothetical protein BV20DRAFT_969209 [Pilatotrama ljubarskyi]|nr:hypothetical protein BV20DRAFT_969209 [Pilatotrama ljubarskyi]